MWLDPKFWREVMLRSPDLFQKVSAAFMEAATKIRLRSPPGHDRRLRPVIDHPRHRVAVLLRRREGLSRRQGVGARRGQAPRDQARSVGVRATQRRPGMGGARLRRAEGRLARRPPFTRGLDSRSTSVRVSGVRRMLR
jgi:hypothetical protein